MKFHIMFIVFILMAILFIQSVSDDVTAHDDNETDDDHDHMPMYEDGWGDHWWGFWMIIVMIGCALFFVFILFLLFREGPRLGNQQLPRFPSHNNALSLLDERYVRGEIPREEYVKMKADLKK